MPNVRPRIAQPASMRLTAASCLLIAVAVLSACGGEKSAAPACEVISVAVTPATSSIEVGESRTLNATIDETNCTGLTPTWTSSNAAVATVSTGGVVTGVSAGGPVLITATAGTHSGAAAVSVRPAPACEVISVAVSPATNSIEVGESRTLNATIDQTNCTGLTPIWSSSDAAVATVSTDGVVTGVTAGGPALITATVGTRSGVAAVSVNPAAIASIALSAPSPIIKEGENVQVTAAVADARGTALTGRTLTWSSSNPAAATVDPTGRVTGVAAGGANITARDPANPSVSGTTVILVRAIVQQVAVTAPSPSLNVGQTLGLIATVTSTRNLPITDRTVSWTSSNPSVATVSTTGQVAGISAGTVTIQASLDGVSGSVALTVVALVPTSLLFVSPSSTGQIGVPIYLTTQMKDQFGNVMTGRQVTWSVSDAGLATVGPGGAWTRCAVEGGTCTVTGTRLVRYGVDPWYFYKEVTDSVPCTNAAFGDAVRNVVKVCDTAGRLTSTGTAALRPLGAGAIVVRAISTDNPALQASLPITIAATGKLWSATARSGAFGPLQVGVTRGVGVFPGDSLGDQLKIALTATSDDPSVLTISNVGGDFVLTGVAAGTATIAFAPPAGMSGSPTVSVTVVGAAAAVSSVAVTLNSSSLAIGQVTQATATARDAQNNVLIGRAVAWASSNSAVATVNASSGLVTAVSAGTANITATSEGVTGSATVTVVATQAAVNTVTITLPTTTLTVGQATTAAVVLRDAQGNVLSGRAVTWSSSAPGVATVSAAGVVTGVSAGLAQVSATSEGKTSNNVAVTVTAPPAATRLAYAMVTAAGTTVPDFTNNLAGGAPTVVYGVPSAGKYVVTFPGMAASAGQSEYYHVTPEQNGYCAIASSQIAGADLQVVVDCWNFAGGLLVAGQHGFSLMAVGNGVFGGRSSFFYADQPTNPGPYTPNPGLGRSYTSANVSIQLQRTATGTYTANTGLFPRTTGREVPLVGAVGVASTSAACESQGIDVFGGTGLEDIQCRGVNNALVDANHMSLIFSQGRPGTAWGFAYYPQDASFDPTPYRLQSDGAPVALTANGSARRATFSALPTTGPRLVQVMPNFNGFSAPPRWISCGYAAVNIAAKTYDVVCQTSLGAIVASDFVIIVAQ